MSTVAVAFKDWSPRDLALALTRVGEAPPELLPVKAKLIVGIKAVFDELGLPHTEIRPRLEQVLSDRKKAAQVAAKAPIKFQTPKGGVAPRHAVAAPAKASTTHCQCLTQKGTPCTASPLSGSRYCGRHKACKSTKGQVSPEQVVALARKGRSERLKKVFDQKAEKKPSMAERRRMAKECPNCCGLVDGDGVCKYPVCASKSCDVSCDRVYASTIAARMQKKNLVKAGLDSRVAGQIQTACKKGNCGDCKDVYSSK